MSLVLYRKYRPQNFAEFIGQEHIIQTLTNAISSGLISHAYLFSGPRGSGKTSLARLFAKAVNCQTRKNGEAEPCNKCSSCREITESRSLDLIEIDAASHRGIDEVRELRDGIRFVPVKSKYKVFIFDEAHQLSKDAANALLKTLEEPPTYVIFILATTEIHKMIPTIISRCQRFNFSRLTLAEILKKLDTVVKKEKIKIEKSALELIALNSQGSLRDAESLLDQVFTLYGSKKEQVFISEFSKSSFPSEISQISEGRIRNKEIKAEDLKDLLGLVEIGLISQFTDFLAQKKSAQAINFLNELSQKGMDLSEFAKALLNYLRQALLLKIMGEDGSAIVSGLTQEEFQKLKEQSETFKEEEIKRIINLFLEAQTKMKYSSIPQLPMELAIIESCAIA